MQKRDRIDGGMFGEIGWVKFRSGCMLNNTVRRTGFLLVIIITIWRDFNKMCMFPLLLIVGMESNYLLIIPF